MSTNLVVNGTAYAYPAVGDQNWGTAASAWAAAVTSGMLQKSGGVFTLTADANFGTTFGLISKYFTSSAANAAGSGVLRLSSTDAISWRNNANAADISLSKNASDQILYNSIALADVSSVQTLTNKTLTSPTITGTGAIAGSFTGTVSLPNGLAASPSLFFTTATSTGMYLVGAGDMAFVANGHTGFEIKDNGTFANVGLGSAPSASSNYVALLQRTNVGTGTYIQVSNPDTGAGSKATYQLASDNGNNNGEVSLFTSATTTDAYANSMTVRPSGVTAHLSLIAGDNATNDIRFYVAGDYTAAGRALQINADKSLQFMQEILTPASPAASTVKLYAKSGDRLYQLNSAGTESKILVGTAAIADGGTGQITASAAFNALSPITLAGDLIVGNGASSATRLGIGGNTQVLTSNGTTASWQPAGGGLSAWVTAVAYTVGNVVTESNAAYICLVNHTSGTFSTDVASGDWQLLSTQTNSPNLMLVNYNFEDNSVGGWTACNSALTNGLPTAVGAGGAVFSSTNGGTAKGATTTAPAVTAVSPIDGVYSLNLATSGAGTIGDGYVSGPIAVSPAYQAKVLTLKFKYQVASGAAALPGTSSNTYAAAVYDVTNNSWLSMAGNFNFVQSSGVGDFVGTCQTNVTTAKIQVFVYSPVAPAGISSLLLDDFYLGQQTAPSGPSMTDWVAYTPTVNNFGTITSLASYYRREGDSMEVRVAFTSGTTVAGLAQITLPNGLNIDGTKIPNNNSTSGNGSAVGFYTLSEAATSQVGSILAFPVSSGNFLYFSVPLATAQGQLTASNASSVVAASIPMFVYARVPIAGWSSNTAMSADTDTRVVALSGAHSASGSIATATEAVITYDVVNLDTHGAYNAGTGLYTVPLSGNYLISAALELNPSATGRIDLFVQKNAVASYAILGRISNPSGTIVNIVSGYILMPSLKAGDTISVSLFQNSGGTLNIATDGASKNTLSINRISGPAVVSATESVNMRYHNSATAISGALATIVWTTKDFDSHNQMGAGTGIYTCPVSGKYQVNAASAIAGTFTLNNTIDLQIQKNGVAWTEQLQYAFGSATDINISVGDIIQCNAGDTIQIQLSSTATLPSITSSNTKNWISITRVGN